MSLGLSYEHRTLARHAPACRAIQLQGLAVVLDDVVRADHAPGLETKDVVVAQVPIPRAVMIHRTRGRDGEARVVGGQISRRHIPIRGRIVRNAEQSHLLDQPVLVRAVIPLDAPLRLRARRANDRDVQFLAYPPEVRVRHLAARAFVRRSLLNYALVND